MSKKSNVLSVRVTAEEFEALARKSQVFEKSISDLLRDALRTIAHPTVSSHTNNNCMGDNRS
jgi:predicted nucleic acid-binding protein